jgi:hypothetical protein
MNRSPRFNLRTGDAALLRQLEHRPLFGVQAPADLRGNGDGSGSTVAVVFIGAVAAPVACVIVGADRLPTQIVVLAALGARSAAWLCWHAIRHPRQRQPGTAHLPAARGQITRESSRGSLTPPGSLTTPLRSQPLAPGGPGAGQNPICTIGEGTGSAGSSESLPRL